MVEEFFQNFSSIEQFKQTICSKVIDVIRTSNRLSIEEFDRVEKISSCQQKLQRIRQRLLNRIHQIKWPIQSNDWKNDECQEQIEQLIDANDSFFEKIASALDQTETSPNLSFLRTVSSKPQAKFRNLIDNSRERIFLPKLHEKPNSKTPLSKVDTDGCTESIHPYADEINAFEPDENNLRATESQLPKVLEQTDYLFVDSMEKLKILIEHLRNQSELAIDLEHHAYRSFQGLTCLMQISSRTRDFLIDTLILREELTSLNELFTDPKIVKVFHGADWDIEWLQRDFSLYVVNMFDTHQAARILNLPNFSLASLFKYFCHRDVKKQYQLADWRIRPLPDEFVRYAREDTHYLLYIYDCLRNELLKNSVEKLQLVYQKSKEICLKIYKKPTFDENGYQSIYQKYHQTPFNGRQLAVLKALYEWRDRIAREEDESPGYVLPDLMLIQLSEVLPKDQQAIRMTCKFVPDLLEKNIDQIDQLINRNSMDDQCLSMNEPKRMKISSPNK